MDIKIRNNNYFPQQKVPSSTKEKAEWYANCIDFIIDKGVSCNDKTEIINKINILHGNIPDEYYKKTLNPYNSSNEKLQRFPATMRNLDIMSDVVRRYVGEYTKTPHEFIVGSNDAQLVINKDIRLRQAVGELCQQALLKEIQQRIQQKQQEIIQQQQQAAEEGQEQDSSTGGVNVSPEDVISREEVDEFIKKFNENYIDEATQQGEKLLDYIRDKTHDEELYAEAYFNYCAYGSCFTYRRVSNNEIIKENVSVLDAYPIPTADRYIEDQDMFARKFKLSKQQIFDKFEPYLSKKDKDFFNQYYAYETSRESPKLLGYNQYFETYPDVCSKFSPEERKLFRESPVSVFDVNGDLYDVWHVVWKGFVRVGILTYINEAGLEAQTTVDEDFKFDETLGHINIEWTYVPKVYEGYRIGSRWNAIYPIKARPIEQANDNKLPYNGILEPFPLMGEFSIVSIIAPYQIMRNIISYHREMVIAKNKLLLLILPESLFEDRFDDRVYRMAADGTLFYDDSVDSNSTKAQQIRLLNANMGDYIRQLTELGESIKSEAREMVDMTAQRYGEIATSAGKSTTEEAIARGSMGSVSINFAFDAFRCRDYQTDIDLAKIAFVDGISDGYFDSEEAHKILSMSSEEILNGYLSVFVKNSQRELDKLNQLKQWAFSAAQNGDMDMALAAITGNTVNSMKLLISQYQKIKNEHEEQLKQMDQILKQEEIENKLKEIAAKGEEDRKTQELKYYYEMQLKYIDADVSILGDSDTSDSDKNASAERIEAGRREIERMKVENERLKIQSDNYNAAADRNVQREKMQNDLKIARSNKNKYDK